MFKNNDSKVVEKNKLNIDRLLKEFAISNSEPLLLSLKDRFKGEKCVIIGNGPSLNNMDLSFLKNYYTFGQNKIYMLLDKLNIETDFLVVVNPRIIQQSGQEILRLKSIKILEERSLNFLPYKSDIIYYRSLSDIFFSVNPIVGVGPGHTVTYTTLQIAFFLGFSQVYMIGVDHYFHASSEGKPDSLIIRNSKDVDHFDPNYFGKGVRWELPNLEASEYAYKMAKAVFEANGRQIYDATVDGHLNVFEKIDYRELNKKGIVGSKKPIYMPVSNVSNSGRIKLLSKTVDSFLEKTKPFSKSTMKQREDLPVLERSGSFYLHFGIINFQLKDYEKSKRYLKKAIYSKELDMSQMFMAYFYLGECSIIENKKNWVQYFEKGIDALSKKRFKDNQELYWMASTFKRIGDYQSAKKWFKKLIKKCPRKNLLSGCYFHLGEICFTMGKKKKAKNCFNKCVIISPSHDKARDYLEFLNLG